MLNHPTCLQSQLWDAGSVGNTLQSQVCTLYDCCGREPPPTLFPEELLPLKFSLFKDSFERYSRKRERWNISRFKGIFLQLCFAGLRKCSPWHTVSNEHQWGLILGLSILKLHSVGPFVFYRKTIHDHLNHACRSVTFNPVSLEPRIKHREWRDETASPQWSYTSRLLEWECPPVGTYI